MLLMQWNILDTITNSLHCFPLTDYRSTPFQLCSTSGHTAFPGQALLSPIFCLVLLRRLRRGWGSKYPVHKLHIQEFSEAVKHKRASSTELPALAFCSLPSTCSYSQSERATFWIYVWLTTTVLQGCSRKRDGLLATTTKISPQPQAPAVGRRSIPQPLQNKSSSGIATCWLHWWSSFWETAAAAQLICLGEEEDKKRREGKWTSKEFCKKNSWLQLKHRQGEARQADAGLPVPWWETDSNELGSKSSTKQGYEFYYSASVQNQKIVWNTKDLQRKLGKH